MQSRKEKGRSLINRPTKDSEIERLVDLVETFLGMSRGYIPRGNPRRGRKGGDARIRFNKCHRPQVGDVLAPQSRLRGVRFPRYLDSSLLFRALLSRLLNQRIRFVRYTRTVREADTSCVSTRFAIRSATQWNSNRIESNRMESDHRDTLRCVTLQRWLTAPASNTATKISYSETSTRGRAHGTNVGWNYSNRPRPPSRLSDPWNQAVAQCGYSRSSESSSFKGALIRGHFYAKKLIARLPVAVGKEPI